jgi:hypothetical protein
MPPNDPNHTNSAGGTIGGSGSTKSTGSGNTSGVGGGGGGGGGATGSRGSSTGNVGSGNGTNAGGNVGGQQSSSDRDGGMRAGVGQGGGGNAPSGSNTGGQKSSSDQNGGKPSQVGGTNNSGLGSAKPSNNTSPGAAKSSTSSTAKTPTGMPKSPMSGQGTSYETPKKAQNAVNNTLNNIQAGGRALSSFTKKTDPYASTRRGPTGKAGEASQTTTQLRTPLGGPQATAPETAEQSQDKYANLIDRAKAVSRGPGISQGLQPGATPDEFNRTATSYVLANMDRLGVTDPVRSTEALNAVKQFSDVSYNPEGVDRIIESLGYEPVGLRTNNPGNILNSQWQNDIPGYAGPVTSPNGLTYASYTDPRWGLVAQNELLGRYHDMGKTTINDVVNRYAPVDENNTAAQNAAYKQHLAETTGLDVNQPLTREQVQALGPVKTTFENGGRAFAGGPFGDTATPASTISAPTQVADARRDPAAGRTGISPTQLSGIPDPSGSVYDTAGLSRPTIANPTQTAALDDTFAPPVGPSKSQDRLPATEPSYFNDIANAYISPPQQTAAPVKPPNSEWVSTTAAPAWDAEVKQAMATPPRPAIDTPPAPTGDYDIFAGANSTYALPDQIPGIADQGRRLSVPGSYPAMAAPANFPAQGQPYAAYTPPAASAGMSYTPALASLAEALGVPMQQAKQIVDRISITGPENLVATTAQWGPESTAMMTTGLNPPAAYRDPWAAQTPQFQEQITAVEPVPGEPFRNGASAGLPPGYADRYFNSGVEPAGEGEIDPQDDPDEAAADENAIPEGVEVYDGPQTVIGEEMAYPKGPVKKPGKIATAALDGVQPGLGRLAGLIGVDDAINYVINKERNRPQGEVTPIGQRMADNAANRSSSDNQSAGGGMQSNAYYDWILAGGSTSGTTPPVGVPNQQQLDLIYSTFI